MLSFFSSDVRIYEVRNAGSEYDLGFLVGLAVVISILGLLVRMRRQIMDLERLKPPISSP